jgi:hypothetical protein
MRTGLRADSRPNPFGARRSAGTDVTARREFSGSVSMLAMLPEEGLGARRWRDSDAILVPRRLPCPRRRRLRLPVVAPPRLTARKRSASIPIRPKCAGAQSGAEGGAFVIDLAMPMVQGVAKCGQSAPPERAWPAGSRIGNRRPAAGRNLQRLRRRLPTAAGSKFRNAGHPTYYL